MTNPAASLTDILTLQPGTLADEFIGLPKAYGAIGIYGGHFLGQALAAGLATVDSAKLANSLHAYFLRPGQPHLPIVYRVARLRDGRGFASRTITAFQQEVPVFQMMASFKVLEPGDEHQKTMPKVTPAAMRRLFLLLLLRLPLFSGPSRQRRRGEGPKPQNRRRSNLAAIKTCN